jgi:hypothetical protein
MLTLNAPAAGSFATTIRSEYLRQEGFGMAIIGQCMDIIDLMQ